MALKWVLWVAFFSAFVEDLMAQKSYNPPSSGSLPYPCDSNIYCYGDILHTVQMAKLYKDSKQFVDMGLKKPPKRVREAFAKLIEDNGENPSTIKVEEFVKDNFNDTGSEFEQWEPLDWDANPDFIRGIHNADLCDWASSLNLMWKKLGRKISTHVRDHPEKYSQIYMSNPVIVPGGRFREVYYWDSFWTIDGLLLSGMKATVRGMLENFLHMVDTYGHVPNGGRIYYTRRSQPPYLLPMVKMYLESTNEVAFLNQNIHLLEKEFKFWREQRSVKVTDKKGKEHTVALYNARVRGPRPESYREDYETAMEFETEAEKDNIYVELKSGAESGWDYSSRWFNASGSNKGTLKDLSVTTIAPVDLNSLLCLNARILSEFYKINDHPEYEKKYSDIADSINQTLSELFWDENDGIWYDVDITNSEKRKNYYLSNLHPLWSGCYGMGTSRKDTVDKVVDYLNDYDVLDYPGGVPTSLHESGQQWDFPNAWAPLQHLIVMGLHNASVYNKEAGNLAYSLAQKWIANNYKAYKQSEVMFEKYDVRVLGVAGSGGEYDVVDGFGWTNGVAIRFLNDFGYQLSTTDGGNSLAPGLACALFAILINLREFLAPL